MNLALYRTIAGGHFTGSLVNLSEPKSVAALAVATRTLSQACKPYADRIDKIMANDAMTDDAKLTATAEQEAKREDSPAVTAARAEVARLTSLVAEDRSKERPVNFEPLASDGTRVLWSRWTLSTDELAAYRALTDGEDRIAWFAAHPPTLADRKSNIGITRAQHVMLASVYPGKDDLRIALAAGELIIPQDRAEKAAKSKRAKRSETERTDAALDFLFAAVEATPATPDAEKPAAG